LNTIEFYNSQADSFQQQYLSQTAEAVHGSWLHDFIPASGQVLDVGAGVGRDAKWLAELGLDVVAVEPALGLRAHGQTLTNNHSVYWLDDQLPSLAKTYQLQTKFDLILLSAVWMHIPASQRERSFRKLSNLLKPSGRLVISLRHGESPDARVMYPVSVDELANYAQQQGLSVKAVISDDDKLKRLDVFWETVVLELPDDGSGAFPTVRNILMNDSRSSTYKLALIRVLLRIADGYPGSVLRREKECVILPLGLVSLLWARQYKPLLDLQVQQTSHTNKGLGFIKEQGWLKLQSRASSDFSIGNLFISDDAKALDKMLRDIGVTIKNMPAKFITLPNTDKQVFEVEVFRKTFKGDSLFTDLETLSKYGEFSVPTKIWDLMSLYACWIEPVAISEWINVMMSYENNKTQFDERQLFLALIWINPERTTVIARRKVESIKFSGRSVHCVWSDSKLHDNYHIDHCLPFARWPNNDLWNLLPTSNKSNLEKSDKLASSQRLHSAKENIQHWWTEAWVGNTNQEKRFYTEATASLPGLNHNSANLDDVFDALKLQHIRIKEMQQLRVW